MECTFALDYGEIINYNIFIIIFIRKMVIIFMCYINIFGHGCYISI